MKRRLHWPIILVLGVIWIQTACDDVHQSSMRSSQLGSGDTISTEDQAEHRAEHQAENQIENQTGNQAENANLGEITDEAFWRGARLSLSWREGSSAPLSLGEQRAYEALLHGGDGQRYDVSASVSLSEPSALVALSAGALQGIGVGRGEARFVYTPPPAIGARPLETSLIVQVSDRDVSHIEVAPDPLNITANQPRPLAVNVVDRHGLSRPLSSLRSIAWETSDPSLSVERGTLRWDSSVGSPASGWVKAELSGWSARAQVLMGSAPADRVEVRALSESPIRVGDQGQAIARAWRGAEALDTEALDVEIRWISSHPEILQVDESGRWEALQIGRANLIAVATGVWGARSVVVNAPLTLQESVQEGDEGDHVDHESDGGEETWTNIAGDDDPVGGDEVELTLPDPLEGGALRQLSAADLSVVCGRVMASGAEGVLTPLRSVQVSAGDEALDEALEVRRDELGVFCVYGVEEGELSLSLSVTAPVGEGSQQVTATASVTVSAGQLTWLSDWVITDATPQALGSAEIAQGNAVVSAGLSAEEGGLAPYVCLDDGWLWIATEAEVGLWSVHRASAPLRARGWTLDTPVLELSCDGAWGAWRTAETVWSARVDHAEAREVSLSGVDMSTVSHISITKSALYAGTQPGVTYQYDLPAHQTVRFFSRNGLLPVTQTWVARDHLYVSYRETLLVYDLKSLTERYISTDDGWNLSSATRFELFEIGDQLVYRGDSTLRSCSGEAHLLESCSVVTPSGGSITADERLFVVATDLVLSVGASAAQLWRVDESGWRYERDVAHPQASQLATLADGIGVFVDGAQVSIGAWNSEPDEVGGLTLTPTTCPAEDPALCADVWSKSQPLEWRVGADWLGAARCEVEVNGLAFTTPCAGRLLVPSALLSAAELNVTARAYSNTGAIYEESTLITLVEINDRAPRLVGTSARSGVYLPHVSALYVYHSAPVTYADPSLYPVRVVDLGEDNRFENGYTEDQVIEVTRLSYVDALGATRVELSAPLLPSHYLMELRRDFEDHSGNHVVYSDLQRFEVYDSGQLDRDWDCLPDTLEDASDLSHGSYLDSNLDGVADGLSDLDRDTLSSCFELRYNLNPHLADSDADNIRDDLEDTDGDGVGMRDELLAGSDPTLRDTDGDGSVDGFEIFTGGDPLDPERLPAVPVIAFNKIVTVPQVSGLPVLSTRVNSPARFHIVMVPSFTQAAGEMMLGKSDLIVSVPSLDAVLQGEVLKEMLGTPIITVEVPSN